MNTIKIKRILENGIKEEKEIYEITGEDANKYRSLGQATGINMEHCVMIAAKHGDNFWRRVYGYRIIKNEEMGNMMFEEMKKIKPETEEYMTVCFYEKL